MCDVDTVSQYRSTQLDIEIARETNFIWFSGLLPKSASYILVDYVHAYRDLQQ